MRSLPQLCQVSVQRSRELFAANEGLRAPPFVPALEMSLRLKIATEYSFTNKHAAAAAAAAARDSSKTQHALTDGDAGKEKVAVTGDSAGIVSSSSLVGAAASPLLGTTAAPSPAAPVAAAAIPPGSSMSEMIQILSPYAGTSIAVSNGVSAAAAGGALDLAGDGASSEGTGDSKSAMMTGSAGRGQIEGRGGGGELLSGLRLRKALEPLRPQWHPPWKLLRVISGHLGWVNCVAVDATNSFFATGSNDRLLKIWDLATGQLKLSLTGHVSSLKDIQISDRHPYLFSCGEDGRVKCWDLEQNRVVRDYHGHLSGVYTLALHPSLDILCSGGRDAVVRVWDMRTKKEIYCLQGHSGTVMKVKMQSLMPHIISGSQDKMVRLWDLSAGKCQATLTNHKKSIRTLAVHPTEYSFVTCGADRIKVWRSPLGAFERNIEGQNAIPNCCAVRSDGDKSSLVVGTNNGQLHFWDWPSGYKYQTLQSKVQPGSLESENGIFCCAFDRSETRLITGECDKTIKVWTIDEEATEETHPIKWPHGRDTKKLASSAF